MDAWSDKQFWEWIEKHDVPLDDDELRLNVSVWSQCVLSAVSSQEEEVLPSIMAFLLNEGVDVNKPNRLDQTPIMWMTRIHRDDIFESCTCLLLDAGANLHTLDDDHENILFWNDIWDDTGDIDKMWSRLHFFLELGVNAHIRNNYNALFFEKLENCAIPIQQRYEDYLVCKEKIRLDALIPGSSQKPSYPRL